MVNAIFLHPDLGIGGAERLVVDAGLALQEKGHRVSYVTNHHDPSHCFLETRDGTFPVTVVGDWIPRTIFGYCYALCAYIRMLYLTFYLLLVIVPVERPDILICDQIPIGIPFIKIFKLKVIFYCHFPDLLLSQPGGSLKKFYRKPIDWIEEKSMSYADRIFVNSQFTAGVFKSIFQNMLVNPAILYPSISTKQFEHCEKLEHSLNTVLPDLPANRFLFLSINRYERKKNLSLAIEAMAALETIISDEEWSRTHLVMAGGYDLQNKENVDHYEELTKLCSNHNLDSKITFLKSPNDLTKISLLSNCDCVIYTPSNEHFGIVPLEAMFSKRPVIAVNSGGPTESIENEVTGFLSEPIPEVFAHYMAKLISSPDVAKKLGENGQKRFNDKFSFDAFGHHLNSVVFSVTSENYERN